MATLALTHFKKCNKCGCTKPATTDFFHKSKKSRYGVHAVCKICWRLRRNGHYASNREVELARSNQWNRDNADYVRHKANENYRKNTDKARKSGRSYYKANPDKNRKRVQRWRKENPDRAAAISQNRQARKLGAEGTFTGEDLARIRAEQNNYCYFCAESFEVVVESVDHLTPLSREGTSNWPENLCLACKPCNSSKCDKTEAEFWDYLELTGQMPEILERRRRNAERDGEAP